MGFRVHIMSEFTLIFSIFFCIDGTENKLNYHVNLRSQLRFDLKQPSILIRSKEPEESTITIKVYAGDLRYVSKWYKFKFRTYVNLYSSFVWLYRFDYSE